ncbi:MAG: GYF domain-containing protein [Thermogemmata sp.]|nr:GYF domain-containing protein [Thermogemmata sp.]
MDPIWFVNKNGTPEGPFTAVQLKELADKGELQPDHLIWKEGMANWIPARQIKKLFPESKLQTAVLSPKGVTATTATSTAGVRAVSLVSSDPSPSYVVVESEHEDNLSDEHSQDHYERPRRRKKKRHVESTSSWLYDFLTFRRMIAPILIQAIFWIGVALAEVAALYLIISGIRVGFFLNIWELAGLMIGGGLILMVVGPVLCRLLCEPWILFFRISETLTDIKNALER